MVSALHRVIYKFKIVTFLRSNKENESSLITRVYRLTNDVKIYLVIRETGTKTEYEFTVGRNSAVTPFYIAP